MSGNTPEIHRSDPEPSLIFTTLDLIGGVRLNYHELLAFEIIDNQAQRERIVVWCDTENREVVRHAIPKGTIPYTFNLARGPGNENVVTFFDFDDGERTLHDLWDKGHRMSAVPKYTFPSPVASQYFQARIRDRQLLATLDVDLITRQRHTHWRGNTELAQSQQIKIWRRSNEDRIPSFTFFRNLPGRDGDQEHYEFDIRCFKPEVQCSDSSQLLLTFVNKKYLDQRAQRRSSNTQLLRAFTRRTSATSSESSSTSTNAVPLHDLLDFRLPPSDALDWESIHITFNHSGDAHVFARTCLEARYRDDHPNPPPDLIRPLPGAALGTPPPASPVIDGAAKRTARLWWDLLLHHRKQFFRSGLDSGVPRVKIAVVDTGIDITNPWIRENWAEKVQDLPDQGYRDFLNEVDVAERLEGDSSSYSVAAVESLLLPIRNRTSNRPIDPTGHGTHVAGIVMQIVPDATLFVARVLKEDRRDYDLGNVGEKEVRRAVKIVALAILYAVQIWNVDIISLSIGFNRAFLTDKEIDVLRRALDYARAAKVVVFAAASNSGNREAVAFPASEEKHTRVICINSSNGDGEKSSYNHQAQSGYHNFNILGEHVKSTWTQDCETNLKDDKGIAWKYEQGTSIATPIAASVAALIIQFGRQYRPKHLLRLQSPEGIVSIFKRMAKEVEGGPNQIRFYHVLPWQVLNSAAGLRYVMRVIEAEMEDV